MNEYSELENYRGRYHSARKVKTINLSTKRRAMSTKSFLCQQSSMLGVILAISMMIAGCGNRMPTPSVLDEQLEPDSEILTSALTSDGRITPKEWVQLSFSGGGLVEEVMVQAGDIVKKGDTLARLGNREAVEAAVSGASLELLLAEQAYRALNESLETEQQQALQSLNNARQAVKTAEQQLEYWEGTSVEADASLAEAQVIRAEDQLETARDNYDDYEDEERENLTRVRFQEELANAQLAYDNAVRQYNTLVNSGRDFNLTQARTALLIANAQLEMAQEQYNKIRKGPDPDALSAAQARLQVAETQLTASLENLEAMTLRSTMDGEVIDIKLKEGEQVAIGVPVVWLADLSQWMVETDNLTEIDVVEIKQGQRVTIVVDALADLTFTGEVISIDRLFQEKRGDITYTARISMNESDPRFRWGMTCAITFQQP
jgi:HlyD family secretion protein